MYMYHKFIIDHSFSYRRCIAAAIEHWCRLKACTFKSLQFNGTLMIGSKLTLQKSQIYDVKLYFAINKLQSCFLNHFFLLFHVNVFCHLLLLYFCIVKFATFHKPHSQIACCFIFQFVLTAITPLLIQCVIYCTLLLSKTENIMQTVFAMF